MDLRNFCELIKLEYCWFLYNYTKSNTNARKHKYLDFPFCCHLSANLISSYLSVHFDGCFKHYRFNRSKYPHSWSSNENTVIDFTIFQQVLSTDERELFLEHKINDKKQFEELINKYEEKNIYYNRGDYLYTGFDNMFEECRLYGIKYAESIKENALTLEVFMKYVENAIDYVNTNIVY